MSSETPPPSTRPAAAEPSPDALIAALLEIERHIDASGWDQPPRLFALVSTQRLIAAEPALADRLRRPGSAERPGPDIDDPECGDSESADSKSDVDEDDRLTAVEQEHFVPSDDLVDDLAQLSWPAAVDGCAVAVERLFLPAGTEIELPDDPAEAAEAVAAHPQRQEVRVVVGVDRRGGRHGVARVRSRPDELLGATDLVPGLAEVLAHTLA
jgi:hypothetical protein